MICAFSIGAFQCANSKTVSDPTAPVEVHGAKTQSMIPMPDDSKVQIKPPESPKEKNAKILAAKVQYNKHCKIKKHKPKKIVINYPDIDKMIEELLLYSRLEQARDVLQPQTLTLWPWLNSVVAQHAADFPDTDYQLTAVAPALHALTVDADPFYLERALSNLLRNAARYGQGRVEVCLGADETQCWIKVADNGPGIPEGERYRPGKRSYGHQTVRCAL
jgi:nitrogen fixation/metabolism regulation signal transduction histidine kinase